MNAKKVEEGATEQERKPVPFSSFHKIQAMRLTEETAGLEQYLPTHVAGHPNASVIDSITST